jgi:hypothetical protein
MAVGVLMEFSGVTWEQYEQLVQELGLSGPPEGELIHVCGPTSDGGWRTVDVWESQETFERFAELLIPRAGSGVSPAVEAGVFRTLPRLDPALVHHACA